MSSVDLTNELRLAKPRAPEQLRERVMALSERPVREPRFSFSLPSRYTVRRVALVAVPAVVAVAVGGAAIHGIANSGRAQRPFVSPLPPTSTVPVFEAATPTPREVHGAAPLPLKRITAHDSARKEAGCLAPSLTRLQQYQASLTVRVEGLDALSPSTQKAMRIARCVSAATSSPPSSTLRRRARRRSSSRSRSGTSSRRSRGSPLSGRLPRRTSRSPTYRRSSTAWSSRSARCASRSRRWTTSLRAPRSRTRTV